MTRPWSSDDDALLRAEYKELGATALAAKLGRTPGAVSGRAYVLGLRTDRHARSLKWSAEEDAVLRQFIATETYEQIQKRLPGRTVEGVNKRARQLGLRSPRTGLGRTWMPTDDDLLHFYWGEFKPTTIAKKLGRTPAAVKARALVLGLGAPSRGTKSLAALAEETGYSRGKLENAARAAGISIRAAVTYMPRKGKIARTAIDEEDVDKLIEFLRNRPDGANITRSTTGSWGGDRGRNSALGTKPDRCVACGTNERPYVARDMCGRCYSRMLKAKK